MRGALVRWGNGFAVRIPKPVVEFLHLSEGDALDMDVSPDGIMIMPARRRYTLEELVAGMTPDNQPDENFDFSPVGAEVVEWQPH